MTVSTKSKNFKKLKHRMYKMLRSVDELTGSTYFNNNHRSHVNKDHGMIFGQCGGGNHQQHLTTPSSASSLVSNEDKDQYYEVFRNFSIYNNEIQENNFQDIHEASNPISYITSHENNIRHQQYESDSGLFTSKNQEHKAHELFIEDRCLAGSSDINSGKITMGQAELFPRINVHQFDRENPEFISLTPCGGCNNDNKTDSGNCSSL